MSGHSAEKETGAIVLDTRRRRTREEREAIVGELLAPGAKVSAVARRHGVTSSLLYRWRREAELKAIRPQAAGTEGFLPVRLSASPNNSMTDPSPRSIAIVLGGMRLIVDERSDLALLKRVITALSA